MPFVFSVSNPTEQAIDLILHGRIPIFDVIVTRDDGEIVWRRLEGEIIPAILLVRRIAPAERFELKASWNQHTRQEEYAEVGTYLARGLLPVEGEPLETPAIEFRIEAK
ncbi:MAG: hypothetical protein ABR582_03540 [Gemmatimonadaceae bacterium]